MLGLAFLGGAANASAHAAGSHRLKVAISSFTATPASLPAAGGTVRIQVGTRHASECRFSSLSGLHGLPVTRKCRSGVASVTLRIAANATLSAQSVAIYVTAQGKKRRHAIDEVTVVVASAATAPTIVEQPLSESVPTDTNTAFVANATGNPLPTVQWQLSTNGGSSWAGISGATQPIYVVTPNATETGYQYRAVFTNQVGTAISNAATLTVPIESYPSQAGYFDYALPLGTGSFTSIQASWIVPTVTCLSGSNSWAVEWPGIGWNTSVVQDGTQVACVDGTPTYDAWYELYGDSAVSGGNSVTIPETVHHGDAITASVSIANNTWTLTVADHTAPWTYTFTTANTTPGLSQGSAQVTVEGPPPNTSYQLADFGTLSFSGVSAVENGQAGGLGTFSPLANDMTTSPTADALSWSGYALRAATGALDPTGEDFTETWEGG